MAVGRGQIVAGPARRTRRRGAGSSTRTTTLRRPRSACWAIWAITRFVLSPLVEAMKTSACSIPASSNASTSSAVPTVKRPPGPPRSPRGRRRGARATADPRRGPRRVTRGEARLATVRPTRPAPTMRTNMARSLLGGHEVLRHRGVGLLARRRRGEDHAARRLVITYLVTSPTKSSSAAAAAERGAAPDPRRLLGREHDHLHAAPPRLLDDRLAGASRAHRRGRDLDALVLLPHRLGAARAPRGRARAAPRAGGRRSAAPSASRTPTAPRSSRPRSRSSRSLAGQPAGGLDDVVVERRRNRHEDRAELGLEPSRAQRPLGHGHAARVGLPCARGRRRRARGRRAIQPSRRTARRRGG